MTLGALDASTLTRRMFLTGSATVTGLAVSSTFAATAAPSREAVSSPSAGSEVAKIDSIFAEWNRPDVPGGAVVVIRDGKPIYNAAFGCADLDAGVKAVPTTRFLIASASKQFVAFAAAQLVKSGKLSLSDDVRRHVPELPRYSGPITVGNLIYHTSGLKDYESLLRMSGTRKGDETSQEDSLRIIFRQQSLNFDPGAHFSYTNSGYNVLALLVERLTQQPFAAWFESNVAQPLGLEGSVVVDDYERILPGSARSYTKAKDRFKRSIISMGDYGSTGIWSTAQDLAKWGWNYLEPRVGDRALFDAMFVPGRLKDGTILGYSQAIIVGKYLGLTTIEHAGSDGGFRAQLLVIPELKTSIAILSNRDDAGATEKSYQIVDLLAKQVGAKRVSAPEKIAPIADPQRFEGDFRLQLGPVITLKYQGGMMTLSLPGQPTVPLAPDGPTGFKFEPLKAHVEFQDVREGKFDKLLITLFGAEEYIGIRVRPQAAASADLGARAPGRYASDELEMVVTVEQTKDGFVLRHHRLADMVLAPMGGDRFIVTGSAPYGEIAFSRNRRGEISGFSASGARALGVRFRRLPVVDA